MFRSNETFFTRVTRRYYVYVIRVYVYIYINRPSVHPSASVRIILMLWNVKVIVYTRTHTHTYTYNYDYKNRDGNFFPLQFFSFRAEVWGKSPDKVTAAVAVLLYKSDVNMYIITRIRITSKTVVLLRAL